MILKRSLSVVLVLITLLGLAACSDDTPGQTTAATTQPTEETLAPAEPLSYFDENTNEWVIADCAGLELLREHPDGNFRIAAEIDCGGMEWTPIEAFSGRISGLWGGKFNHTISNLRIREQGDAGFFLSLSGTVEDLNFDNISVDTNGNAGFLAVDFTGTVKDVDGTHILIGCTSEDVTLGGMFANAQGVIEDCSIRGNLTATKLTGSDNRIGGFAGVCTGNLTNLDIRTAITVATTEGGGNVGGIAGIGQEVCWNKVDFSGYLRMDSGDAPFSVGTLAGSLDGVIMESYSSAREYAMNGTALTTGNTYCGTLVGESYLTDCWIRDVSSLDEHLPIEELTMRQKAVDYMYATCTIPWTPVKDMHYSDSCSSHHIQNYKAGTTYFGQPYTHFCASLERFTSVLEEDGSVQEKIASEGWEYIIGNDCADAIYWAWSQFSPSITYTLTNNMICTNGTVSVGEYTLANHDLTADTCQLNGEAVMYEAYAQVKMGDGLLFAPGHLRMAAEAAYVYRNEDGSINPEKSYIRFHEQGSTMKVEEHFSTCSVNKKATFAKLFSGNYIPVTIPEFAQGAAGEILVVCDTEANSFSDVFSGTITSNYRINWVTTELFDGEGNLLASDTIYPTAQKHNDTFSLMLLSNTVRKDDLEAGKTYRIAVKVGVADQQEITVRDLTFTP